jgi:enamine deaminase RidA (YjgF/YER057c/UK114 family)
MRVHNPASIHPPAGNYSHGVALPANCRSLFVAGQTGMRADGSTPAGFEEQCEVVWQNIRAIVEDAGMKLTDIARLTVLLTDRANLPKFAEVRKRYLGDHKPAATGFVVAGLVRPEWLIEVDAIALRPIAAPAGKPASSRSKRAAGTASKRTAKRPAKRKKR